MEEMKKPEGRPDHLLDCLAQRSGCIYLSSLRNPTGALREKLEAAVAGIPVQEATLREWNAALAYLYDAPVEMTAERAKARLLQLLQKRE